MKLRLIPILFIALFALTACPGNRNNAVSSQLDVFNSTLSAVGEWKVIYAKFGNEDAPVNMYDGYRIRFNANGTYTITNPGSAVNPNRSNRTNSGVWRTEGGATAISGLVIDNTVLMELKGGFTRDRMNFTWGVVIPGKQATTYEWVLIPA